MLLITGGTGFIGSNLVNYLIEKDYNIRLFVRNKQKAKSMFGNKVDIVEGNISNKKHIQKAVKDVNNIVDLLGTIKLRPKGEVYKTNLLFTRNLLRECKNIEKFIFSSSIDVYGPLEKAANENYHCNPIDDYGKSKLEAEKAIIQSDINYSILRIAIVYGNDAAWWNRALGLLKFGFIPKTDNVTHLIHVSDVVRAIELSIKKKKNGVYNIANKNPIKINFVFRYLVELLGKKPKEMPLFLTKTIATILGMQDVLDVALMNRKVDTSKAKKELKFEAKADVKKMLKEMVEHYKYS